MKGKKSTTRAAALAACGVLAAAASFAADQTLPGTISDNLCTAKHTMTEHGKNLNDHDCTQMCSGHGAAYVLLSNGKVYKLRNKEGDLKTHAGHVVNLTGSVSGDTIKVSKVEMPKN